MLVREISSQKKSYPNSSIRAKHIDEDLNLIEIDNWIINFKNYIIQGYSDDVPNKGRYTPMRPLLDDSWATSLDRNNASYY